MSSQLAAQLRILAGGGAASTSRPTTGGAASLASSATLAGLAHAAPGSTAAKYRASFLFAADVAAATDSATVHSMGASGMEQLVKLEPRLRPFLLSLCAAASFDRDAHNQSQLQQVHKQINQCIALLAPFFMLKPTHKVGSRIHNAAAVAQSAQCAGLRAAGADILPALPSSPCAVFFSSDDSHSYLSRYALAPHVPVCRCLSF